MFLAAAAAAYYSSEDLLDKDPNELNWKERFLVDSRRHIDANIPTYFGSPSEEMTSSVASSQGYDHESYALSSTLTAPKETGDNNSPSDAAENSGFREHVRQEWISAVFGSDYLVPTPDTRSSSSGVGLAGIASYVSQSIAIPPLTGDAEKLGISLARLSLGVYVRSVDVGSEAACSGVQVDSVLVSINGMPLLAEPTKQALERLWQYDGICGGPPETSNRIKGPAVLTFIKNGVLYSATFLSSPPFGIQWGPCGTFALIKKSQGKGAAAGVHRGAIVSSINGITFRQQWLDHVYCATELSEARKRKEEIRLTVCYPPSEARSGHYDRAKDQINGTGEKQARATQEVRRQAVSRQLEGVEVRIHPLLWGKTTKHSQQSMDELSRLAARVSMGELVPSIRRTSGTQRTCSPCPPVENLLESWSSFEAMAYCFRYGLRNYDERSVCNFNANLGGTMKKLMEALSSTKKDNTTFLNLFVLHLLTLCQIESTEEQHGRPVEEEKKTTEAVFLSHDDRPVLNTLLLLAASNTAFACRLMLVAQSFGGCEVLLDGLKRVIDDDVDRRFNPRMIKVTPFEGRREQPLLNALPSQPESHPSTQPQPRRKFFRLFRSKKGRKNKHKGRLDSAEIVASSSTLTESSADVHRQDRSGALVAGSPTRKKQLDSPSRDPAAILPTSLTRDNLFANTCRFLTGIDTICSELDGSFLRSISQKITEWVLQPWNASKGTTLAKITHVLRERLSELDDCFPMLGPTRSGRTLLGIDASECYVLPSAHFPMLLTFECAPQLPSTDLDSTNEPQVLQQESMYQVSMELLSVEDKSPYQSPGFHKSFVCHGAVSGCILSSGKSVPKSTSDMSTHVWDSGNVLTFEARSTWGAPNTLALKLSEFVCDNEGQERIVQAATDGTLQYSKDSGLFWIDLSTLWKSIDSKNQRHSEEIVCHLKSSNLSFDFDGQGDLVEGLAVDPDTLEVRVRLSVRIAGFGGATVGPTYSLLYKHDDDLRQEMFATHFIRCCDEVLKRCGLDMFFMHYDCVPVGGSRGFVEWIPGSVPLSEICRPVDASVLGGRQKKDTLDGLTDIGSLSTVAKAGLRKFESLYQSPDSAGTSNSRSSANPIQDYLRSVAFDASSPYMIRRDVMDKYVKSCAGYSVVTYVIGCGDRHLDNLLLHQSGRFFHCDFSFILGNDPKKSLPIRVTEDMVRAMGGRDSDNFAKFQSLAAAAFLTLRRPENVRLLLSLIRSLETAGLPDISITQKTEDALSGVRDRLKLDLSQDEAISFIESLIDDSTHSKMWIAVDAIHSLGKRF